MSVPDGYMTIDQVVQRYGRTRQWWYRQVSEGKITGYDIPGLRGTYLREMDVEERLRPKPKPRDAADDDDGANIVG